MQRAIHDCARSPRPRGHVWRKCCRDQLPGTKVCRADQHATRFAVGSQLRDSAHISMWHERRRRWSQSQEKHAPEVLINRYLEVVCDREAKALHVVTHDSEAPRSQCMNSTTDEATNDDDGTKREAAQR